MLALGALLAAGAVSLVAATLQGTIGFGYGLVAVPICALIDPRLAPVPQLIVTIPLSIVMAAREWRHVDLRQVAVILAGSVPGAVAGAALLRVADARLLQLAIAVIIGLGVVLMASGRRVERTRRAVFAAGFASGGMGLVSSVGGPPLALVYRDAQGAQLRANLSAVFLVGNVMVVGIRAGIGALATSDLVAAAYLFPGLALGFVASRWLTPRVEGARLRTAVLAVSAVSAVMLFWRAW